MKTIRRCPKCGDPMLNEGCGGGVHPERWRLSCIYLDHDILGLTVVGHDELLECLQIAIRMGTDKRDRVYVNWNFEDKELTITKGWLGASFYEPNVIIPYFEPDLAQYDKLIKKLRTYLIFS